MRTIQDRPERAGGAPEAQGLTAAAAQKLLAEHGPNVLPTTPAPRLAPRVARELREPMAALLLVCAALSGLLLGEVVDAVAIVLIVVVNGIIALAQESRAERALEALQALEAPTATVRRDGRRALVDAADLVPGDLVLVQAGDRVPADLEVVATTDMEADEAILTGESVPVAKRVGGVTMDVPVGDRDGVLHTGTLVTRGSGTGRVVATGADTVLGALALRLQGIRRDPTPLQRQLTDLTRRLGGAAVVIAIAAFGLALLVGQDVGVDQAFLTAVALAVAAVPEGLAAVTTVALALGVSRMAGRGAIVRRLAAVETLGAVDVLLVDKTGTLTENRMRPTVLLDAEGAAHDPLDLPMWLREDTIAVMVLCNEATVDPPTGDPTERALLEVVDPAEVEGLREANPVLAQGPFTSERRMMASVNDQGDDGLTVLVKGAPEAVFPRCTSRLTSAGETALSAAVGDRLLGLAEVHARRGERLLALATRRLDAVPDDVASVEHDLCLIGLVALRDPPRGSAARSVREIGEAGVTLLMATGDHPGTASAIAGEIGIPTGATRTGADLTAEGIPEDPTSVTLYTRVDPEQKLELVTRLQTLGHVVAMTGDGVNDAPALRRADIGVALGESGSDVAREAADLVITDDDLATIVAAVEEGRGIYDNLRKVVDYLVTSNLAEILIVLVTLVLVPELGVPLFPLQLLWINLLTDGLPALALGVDAFAPDLMGRAPRPAGSRMLGRTHLTRLLTAGATLAAVSVGALLVAREVLGLDDAQSRTVLFCTVVLAQVLYAYAVRRPGTRAGEGPRHRISTNWWLHASAATAVLLQLLIVLLPAARPVFDVTPPSMAGWILVLIAGTVAPALAWLATHLTRRG